MSDITNYIDKMVSDSELDIHTKIGLLEEWNEKVGDNLGNRIIDLDTLTAGLELKDYIFGKLKKLRMEREGITEQDIAETMPEPN